mgnify:CR=1 FL=1
MSVLNVGTLNSTGGVKLPVYSSGNFPSGPGVQVGQIIFDSTDGEIKLYNGNGWVGLYPQFYADILVVGSSKPTKKKIDQAKKLGIKIITEQEWDKILNS